MDNDDQKHRHSTHTNNNVDSLWFSWPHIQNKFKTAHCLLINSQNNPTLQLNPNKVVAHGYFYLKHSRFGGIIFGLCLDQNNLKVNSSEGKLKIKS